MIMPEESIASYINNMAGFTMMTIASGIVFLALFFIWRGLVHRVKKRYSPGLKIKERTGFHGKGKLSDLRKVPYLAQSIFILVSGFIFVVLFLLLAFSVFNYAVNFRTNQDFYIIIGIVFYLVLMLIFLVNSKILD